MLPKVRSREPRRSAAAPTASTNLPTPSFLPEPGSSSVSSAHLAEPSVVTVPKYSAPQLTPRLPSATPKPPINNQAPTASDPSLSCSPRVQLPPVLSSSGAVPQESIASDLWLAIPSKPSQNQKLKASTVVVPAPPQRASVASQPSRPISAHKPSSPYHRVLHRYVKRSGVRVHRSHLDGDSLDLQKLMNRLSRSDEHADFPTAGGSDSARGAPAALPVRRDQPMASRHELDAIRRAELLCQMNETDDVEQNELRTFDPKEGRVVHHKRSGLPDPVKLAKSIYAKMWKDPMEVESAERHVATMPDTQQILYAARSLRRKAQGSLNRALKRGVFDESTELLRIQHALRTEYLETVSHLGFDTEELSRIRVHNAATDEVIFEKATYQAKLEVEQFQSNAISADVTRVGILQMQLDHYRCAHVPFVPPSKQQAYNRSPAGASLEPGPGSGRRGSDRGAISRAGVQAIVEKLQHGVAFQFDRRDSAT